jgi:hypothetical protein
VQTELATQTSAQNLELYTIRHLSLDDLEILADLEARASDYSLFMTGFNPQAPTKRSELVPTNSKGAGFEPNNCKLQAVVVCLTMR